MLSNHELLELAKDAIEILDAGRGHAGFSSEARRATNLAGNVFMDALESGAIVEDDDPMVRHVQDLVIVMRDRAWWDFVDAHPELTSSRRADDASLLEALSALCIEQGGAAHATPLAESLFEAPSWSEITIVGLTLSRLAGEGRVVRVGTMGEQTWLWRPATTRGPQRAPS